MRHLSLFIALFVIFSFNSGRYNITNKGDVASGKENPAATLKIRKQNLYIIQRNKNRNTVYYDLNVMPNGDIFSNNPIDCYWKMYEKNGVREELTTMEKLTAYGYDVEKGSRGEYLIKMNSLKNRSIQLTKDKTGNYNCLTIIGGKRSNLKRIYVFTEEGYVLTTVKYIELYGKDIVNGTDTYERVLNN